MIVSDSERIAPTQVEEAEPSHLARYQFALRFVQAEDQVLDIPSGSGYGAKLLSSKAKHVHAIEIFKDAVDHAK